MPSARVRMLRCGCLAASSSVRSPARTRSATRLWSSLTCVSRPSPYRYTRLSPTLATARTSPPSLRARARAHSVVPIPKRSTSPAALPNTAWLARSTARARPTRVRSSKEPSTPATASAEATSPPRWPPMPSASTKRSSPAPKSSWLMARTRPTAEAAPCKRRTRRRPRLTGLPFAGGPRSPQLQDDVADLQVVARAQRGR